MREILFRGKRKDNGEWVEGDLVNNYDEKKFIGEIIINKSKSSTADKYDVGISLYEVIPETVGRYTYLTDKNGKKIFEGDIVKTNKYGNPKRPYIIKYNCLFGAFIGVDKNDMFFTTFDGDSDCFEVISNIHDNPELLEVGNNG